MFPTNLTLAGSEFHRVGAATKKVRVTSFVFTRAMSRGSLLIDRSCLEFLAEASFELRYAVCVDERV